MAMKIDECDKEPIQFIDTIQSRGALIAFDDDNKVVAIAGAQDFGFSEEGLGKNIAEVLKADTAPLLNMLGERVDPTRPMLLRSKEFGKWFTCIAHKTEDIRILELEFLPPKEVDIPSVKFLKDRKEPLYNYLRHIATNLRASTGYDRVMVYRFAPDWHGEVVAESVGEKIHSFLGHHFPASDIPRPARDIFLKNWCRVIFDVNAEPIPIKSLLKSPIDLSRSALRAASPIHLEYLRNMDVHASLTLSLVHEGRLWGLIACHHMAPKYLTAEERNVCSLVARLVSTRISGFYTAESMAAIQSVSDFTAELTTDLSRTQHQIAIKRQKDSLFKFVSCDGFCSWVDETDTIKEGQMPLPSELATIVEVLNAQDLDIVHTEKLKVLDPKLANIHSAAGMLAVRLDGTWLLWFRKAYDKSQIWAGKPEKQLVLSDTSARLTPRSSFDAWAEEVKDTSKPWEISEVSAALMLRTEILRYLDGNRTIQPSRLEEYQEILESLYLQVTDDN